MKKDLAIFSKLFGLGLFLILVVVVITDFNKLQVVFARANFLFLFLAIIASLISVSMAAFGFTVAANIFLIESDFKSKFRAGWLGVAMNNLIMSGGAVGYGVRVRLLRTKQTRTRQIISASLFYSFIFQLFMAVALPACFLFFYNSDLIFAPTVKVLILISVLLSLSAIILFGGVFFLSGFRRNLFHGLSKILAKFFKKNWRSHFVEIDEMLAGSLNKANIINICLLFLSVMIDWIFCTSALYLAFLTLGVHVSAVFLFCAFVISVAIGYISVLPGGLGTQDLSLAGIMVLGGYDLQTVILVAVLFRLIYYAIPYGLASVSYNLKSNNKSNLNRM